MVERLASQLHVLNHVAKLAFGPERRNDFLAEVATKLRVLTVRSKHNKPLLLEVADRLSITVTVKLGGPPIPFDHNGKSYMPGDDVPLDEFLDFDALMIRTSAGLITFTKRQLIRAWSEQLGGAHEDWAVDEGLINALNSGIQLGGMDPTAMELRNTARVVLARGNDVVDRARALLKDSTQ